MSGNQTCTFWIPILILLFYQLDDFPKHKQFCGKKQVAYNDKHKLPENTPKFINIVGWKTPEPKAPWTSFKNTVTGESCRFRSNLMTVDEMLCILGPDAVQTVYNEDMWKK